MNIRAKTFKAALAKKKWTQAELARNVGMTRAGVGSFIRTLNSGGKPQAAKAQKYADALGIDVEKLL